jgi:hypothetical protein
MSCIVQELRELKALGLDFSIVEEACPEGRAQIISFGPPSAPRISMYFESYHGIIKDLSRSGWRTSTKGATTVRSSTPSHLLMNSQKASFVFHVRQEDMFR